MIAPWIPNCISFLSGLPEIKRRRRPLVILQAYLDESGTRNQDVCFVLAGFIAPAEVWANFSDQWQQCLDAPPALNYFKMREAVNNPTGAFRNWKRSDVRRKVQELVEIIKSNVKLGIHCTIPISGFDEIIAAQNAGPFSNPYSMAFYAVLAGIGWEALEHKADGLDVIFDIQDKYSGFVKGVYPLMRRRVDSSLGQILPVEPMFKDDRQFLPLQAADMLAWLFRNAFNGRRTEWEWIANELMPVIPMSEYSTIYTDERLRNVQRLTAEVKYSPEEIEEVKEALQWVKRRNPSANRKPQPVVST
jgi:hypothetical protein